MPPPDAGQFERAAAGALPGAARRAGGRGAGGGAAGRSQRSARSAGFSLRGLRAHAGLPWCATKYHRNRRRKIFTPAEVLPCWKKGIEAAGPTPRACDSDLDQAAGQPRPARRHHRGLRRRLDHQTTARARAAHRGPDRDAHGPEDPDVKPVQARLSRLPAIPCQPARATSMGSQTRLPTRGSTGLHVTYLRWGAQNQSV